jgi:hypothetical protein
MIIKILITGFFILLLSFCTDPTDPELGDIFELAFGQTTEIHNENLSIKFLEVVEDSRCPLDAVCVWEGNAEIVLLANQDTVSLNTTLEPKIIDVGSYTIELISVSPYPETTIVIANEYYISKLVVTK